MKKNVALGLITLERNLFFLSLLSILVFSCQKDKGRNNAVSDESSITLKANGQPIEYRGNLLKNASGVRAFTGIASAGTPNIRKLTVRGENGLENGVEILIKADSVMAGNTYVINSQNSGAAQVKVGGKGYMVFATPGLSRFFLSVTITQHAGGRISGTFSGKLGHPTNTFEELSVTDGTFNATVVY